MRLSFSDYDIVTEAVMTRDLKRLKVYQEDVTEVVDASNDTRPEYALTHINAPSLHETLEAIKKAHKGIKHLFLIGIGGSSLGVEAVHQVLDTGVVKLSVLDTLAPHELKRALGEVLSYKKASDFSICVVSKSGATTETLVNAAVFLQAVKEKFGVAAYSRTIFVGDPGTEFMKQGKKLGATCVAMPKAVGGRYSIATEAGLVPLALLQHNVDEFIDGCVAASDSEIDDVAAQGAVRLYQYMQKNYTHYNFFAFEKRLALLGAWYRQLFAESIGKQTDKDGKRVQKGMVPTISTPVELHSIGQLYLSEFSGVYTDFITFDDETTDFKIPSVGVGKQFSKHTMQEVVTALYGGVVGSYVEKQLPHRTTIFEEERAYELGLFMSMRMRETMYLAHLMNVNAFDQPNVEGYKIKTKDILGL